MKAHVPYVKLETNTSCRVCCGWDRLEIASSDMIDTMKGGGPCGSDVMWFVGFQSIRFGVLIMWDKRLEWHQIAQHMLVCQCVAVCIANPVVSSVLWYSILCMTTN